MRASAILILCALLFSGCASESDEEAPASHVSAEAPANSPPANTTAPPSAATPVADSIPGWVAFDDCIEYDFGFPASEMQPSHEWFPERLEPMPFLGPFYSYNLFLWDCDSLLVDNQSLSADAHLMIVETAVDVPEDHPYRGPYDQLYISAYSDSPPLVARLGKEGFRINNATFAIHEEAADMSATIGGAGFEYNLSMGAVVEGDNPPTTLDVRMHARSSEARGHVFFDLLRNTPAGRDELVPRSAVAQVRAEWVPPGQQTFVGIASTTPLHASIWVPPATGSQ